MEEQTPYSTLRENCSLVAAEPNSCRSREVISKAITALQLRGKLEDDYRLFIQNCTELN